MDEIDRNSEFEEKVAAMQIKAAAMVKRAADATGRCLNCGKRVRAVKRWCDEDCRDDWQLRQVRAG